MTLKKSFFDAHIFWDSLKRSSGVGILYFLTLLVSMPIALLMELQNIQQRSFSSYYDNGVFITAEENKLRALSDTVAGFFSLDNKFFSLMVIAAAIATACVLFSYLHYKNPTYFYHSLPVSRPALFVSRFTAGLVIALLPFVVNTSLAIGVAATMGCARFLPSRIIAWLGTCLLFFLIIYAITILAGMLCGNVITHILGAAVFLFGPAYIHLVYLGFMETFYETFYYQSNSSFTTSLSPVTHLVSVGAKTGVSGWYLAVIALLSLIFIALSMLLYTKRPSEGAGKAVAFYVSRPLIKYPLVALISFGAAFVFHAAGHNSSRLFWLFFGFLFSAFIAHAVIEVIYNASLRAMFNHLKGLLIYCAAGALVICIPAFDLTGYDVYLPRESDVVSVRLNLSNVESAFNIYYYRQDRLLDRELKDPMNVAAAYRMMEGAVSGVRERKELLGGRSSPLGVSVTSVASTSYVSEPVSDSSLIVGVKLKNGREVWRRYSSVGGEVFLPNYETLFNSEEYKKSRFPVFDEKIEPENLLIMPVVDRYAYNRYTLDGLPVLNPQLTNEQALAVTSALKRDILAFNFGRYKAEYPLYTIQYVSDEYQFPPVAVYPSYTDTLSKLLSLGIEKPPEPSAGDIISLTIDVPPEVTAGYVDIPTAAMEEYGYGYLTFEITDPDEIAEILDASTPSSIFQYSPFLTRENIHIGVNYNTAAKFFANSGRDAYPDTYYFKPGQVPDFIVERVSEKTVPLP